MLGEWTPRKLVRHSLTGSHSATALQSIEIACDTLLSGKAKVMIAGGFDDISEEGSYEFANMKATSNSETEFAMGREPTEMSRPATTTRAGFMESQGTGVHILMSARTALELGAPIRGIIAFTSTSTYDPCLISPFLILMISQRQGWAVCSCSGSGGTLHRS